MRRMCMSGFVVLAIGLMAAITGCSSSSTPSAASSAQSSVFCRGDIKLDKASVNVTTEAGFLAVLKANQSALDSMAAHLPGGKVGTEAREEISAAKTAITTGNFSALNNVPSSAGGDIDTYCGVDGDGNPLPSYFGAGKTTSFCSVADEINSGTQNATSAAQVLTYLSSHQNLVSEYASRTSGLPSPVRGDAQKLVSTARSAIATNNSALLSTTAVSDESMAVMLYCGQND